jgi:hypothetical protein
MLSIALGTRIVFGLILINRTIAHEKMDNLFVATWCLDLGD